jgi:hypothetical protein
MPLETRLTPQLPFASLQFSRLLYYIHSREVPHLESVHADHDQQP